MEIETQIFLTYEELLEHLAERGPMRQFQVAYLGPDDDEGEPAMWSLNIVNSDVIE